MVDLLAASFIGPLFVAAIELRVAARTDPELRAALIPLENPHRPDMYQLAVTLLGADESRPGVRQAAGDVGSAGGWAWPAGSPMTPAAAKTCWPVGNANSWISCRESPWQTPPRSWPT